MINLHERMLPTLAGVELATTSWSPVGRPIQLSHQGRLSWFNDISTLVGHSAPSTYKGRKQIEEKLRPPIWPYRQTDWSGIEFFTYEPCDSKACLQAYVDSKGPDQHAHLHSLISAFTVINRLNGYYRINEWRAKAWLMIMHKTIWICIFHTYMKTCGPYTLKTLFLMAWLSYLH